LTSPATVEGADTPLGDRTDMVYMHTNVTRAGVPASRWQYRMARVLDPQPRLSVLRN